MGMVFLIFLFCSIDFYLDNLKDCEVLLLDHTAQLTIDDCSNCKIVLGPCEGSIFIRDCSNCEIFVIAYCAKIFFSSL